LEFAIQKASSSKLKLIAGIGTAQKCNRGVNKLKNKELSRINLPLWMARLVQSTVMWARFK
jgi:hypothetical protein